ncbi:MAG: NADPH-dependent oxidoreductase [Deltaproteobacteria bacterium]|nr:MAG: NADPH-dependent oxidoreductase [Deltaproteobacteria bacterium]
MAPAPTAMVMNTNHRPSVVNCRRRGARRARRRRDGMRGPVLGEGGDEGDEATDGHGGDAPRVHNARDARVRSRGAAAPPCAGGGQGAEHRTAVKLAHPPEPRRDTMKILILPASLRKDSLNRRLGTLIRHELEARGAKATLADFHDYAMPLYDGDLEQSSGLPDGAKKLAADLRAHDALVLVSPEYNYSIPGVLKNAIDWVSRERPTNAWKERPILLCSASPAGPGGIRGLWQLRIPLEGNFAHVHSPMFALSQAHEAFADDGSLRDEKLHKMLRDMLGGFIAYASALNG